MTVTEGREENLAILRTRYPTCNVQKLDLEAPGTTLDPSFDVVYCYGLLYHLSNPRAALSFLAQHTKQIFLLETAVSFGDKAEINLITEPRRSPTQAVSGTGCRPTRPWLYHELKSCFEFVYVPVTQPCDKEFPLDWSSPGTHAAPLQRAIFVASRHPIANELLSPQLLMNQRRQE